MISYLNSFRAFPEGADFQQSLNRINSSEKKIAKLIHQAFEALPGYNEMQRKIPQLFQSLNDLTQWGLGYWQFLEQNRQQLESFPAKYDSLTKIHTEMKNWLNVRNAAKKEADQSQEISNKAKSNLDKAKNGNNQSQINQAESYYETASRKAEMDAQSFNDTEKHFNSATEPCKRNFIDEFRNTTNELLEKRMQIMKDQKNLCVELDKIIESFVEFDDPNMQYYRKMYEELESIEQEGFCDENDEQSYEE